METADLGRYNHVVRGLYFDAMAKLPWGQVVEPRGLSYGSMRDVFLHLILVEDRWISYTIPERFSDWVDPDFDDFKEIDELRKYMQKTKVNTEKYLEKLSLEDLKRQIVVPWGDKPAGISIEKALTHMVLENMIHYGELSAAFWQMDLAAPYMGFWRYKL